VPLGFSSDNISTIRRLHLEEEGDAKEEKGKKRRKTWRHYNICYFMTALFHLGYYFKSTVTAFVKTLLFKVFNCMCNLFVLSSVDCHWGCFHFS
jgi:hypothetical protein